jgi:membrane protein DedA with SNARE-associated domain
MLAILKGIYIVFDLPEGEAFFEMLRINIQTYGLPLSFVGAFLEGLFCIGWYFPGSSIIFLSVIFAGSAQYAALSVVVVTTALYLAYCCNYFLGKHGWHRLLVRFGMQNQLDDAERQLNRHGLRAIFFTFWNPGLASLVATAAGTLRYPFKRFALASFVALSIWNTFWGVLAYVVGEKIIEYVFSYTFILIMIGVWIVVRIIEIYVIGPEISPESTEITHTP